HPVTHDFAGPPVPLSQAKHDQQHTLAIDYDPATTLCRAFLVDGDTWTPLGEHRLYLSTVQAELKVDVPYDGVTVDVAFDNMRLYPRPQTNPVRIVAMKPPFPGFPFRGVRVSLADERGNPLGGPATTDANGEVSIRLPADRLYPAGGEVLLRYRGKVIGTAPIKAAGVNGLYPGDVWVITAPDEYKYEGKTYPLGY
ncbi:hypothetical protein HQ590_05430, partial [bacterium]|nr:hypothetical protein [bacterium]